MLEGLPYLPDLTQILENAKCFFKITIKTKKENGYGKTGMESR